MKLFLLVATGLAALLDFSIGTLIVFVFKAQLFTGSKSELWQYLLGGLLAVSPDILGVLKLYVVGSRNPNLPKVHHHDSISHRPLAIIPLASAAAYAFGGMDWAWIAGLCLFAHYLHDTKGFGGSNMAWLWPFVKKPISLWPIGIERDTFRMDSFEDHRQWLIKNYIELSLPSYNGLIFAIALVVGIITVHFNLNWLWQFGVCVGSILLLFAFRHAYHSYTRR